MVLNQRHGHGQCARFETEGALVRPGRTPPSRSAWRTQGNLTAHKAQVRSVDFLEPPASWERGLPGSCRPHLSFVRSQARKCTHFLSICAASRPCWQRGQPIFDDTEPMAAHCDSCSPWWSRTNRTARSRSSREYLFDCFMAPVLKVWSLPETRYGSGIISTPSGRMARPNCAGTLAVDLATGLGGEPGAESDH